MKNPLFEHLFKKHENSEKTFLSFVDGTSLTYGEYIRMIYKFSSSFRAMGLKPGDRISLKIEKSQYFLVVYGACIHSGFIFLPINENYTTKELLYFLKDSESKLLITTRQEVVRLEGKITNTDLFIETLEKDGTGSLPALAKCADCLNYPEVRNLKDIAALLYTSGTTGRPKAAMITHENLISNSKTLTETWGFSGDDKLIHALPVYHTHGLFVATNVILLSSASMFFLSKFDIDIIIKLIPKSTTIMGVPTYYVRLLESPKLTRKLTRDMRLIVSGSAPLTKEMSDKFFERTGKRILERYGMTETNMISSNPYDGERKAGSVGYPLPDINLRICNPESGLSLPAGKVGEIELKGKNVFSGYWRMQKETQEAFRLDGFFRTGDLGKFDNQGYLEIVGRLKDLIITGGLNVYPKEIENVLNSFVGIEESAVIGLPHDDFGESILAVIISEKGNKLYKKDLIQYLEDNLAKYKCPKAYVSETSLPRNNLGKVLKNLLREKYRNYFTDLKKS